MHIRYISHKTYTYSFILYLKKKKKKNAANINLIFAIRIKKQTKKKKNLSCLLCRRYSVFFEYLHWIANSEDGITHFIQ